MRHTIVFQVHELKQWPRLQKHEWKRKLPQKLGTFSTPSISATLCLWPTHLLGIVINQPVQNDSIIFWCQRWHGNSEIAKGDIFGLIKFLSRHSIVRCQLTQYPKSSAHFCRMGRGCKRCLGTFRVACSYVRWVSWPPQHRCEPNANSDLVQPALQERNKQI